MTEESDRNYCTLMRYIDIFIVPKQKSLETNVFVSEQKKSDLSHYNCHLTKKSDIVLFYCTFTKKSEEKYVCIFTKEVWSESL